jgi:hypothetical protein
VKVPAVVNRECAQSIPAKHTARGVETAPKHVAVKRLAQRRGLKRANDVVVALGALIATTFEPNGEIGQRAGVPPERDTTGTTELGALGANHEVRAGNARNCPRNQSDRRVGSQ